MEGAGGAAVTVSQIGGDWKAMPMPPFAVLVKSLCHAGMEIRPSGPFPRLGRGIPERWGAAAGGPRYLSAMFCHFEVIP